MNVLRIPACSLHANCLNTQGSFKCKCKQGYKGSRCSHAVSTTVTASSLFPKACCSLSPFLPSFSLLLPLLVCWELKGSRKPA